MKIIDNFLERGQFSSVKNLMFSDKIEWYYEEHMVENDPGCFSHCFYDFNRIKSNYFENFEPVLLKLEVKSLIKIRVNLYISQKEIYESEWHEDFPYDNSKTAILYLNTCNGKTALKTKEGIKEVDSIENRMLVFPAKTEHKMISQTNTKRRIVVNFNYF